ncbi:MAG: SGNH/GDSL hydrolase family protein [Actinomycetota bacterium]|nr:SGNH/GDSL hydrolase family protein [Actinomycetota bacterium]
MTPPDARPPPRTRLALARCAAAQARLLAVGSFVRRFRLGMAETRGMVAPYALAWDEANRLAVSGDAPLWVVLGDSAAQGVGATGYDRGYVGQLREWLSQRDGVQWRVLNLSRSGARAADVLATQLPALEALSAAPDLVTCVIGANDLLRTPLPRLLATFRAIVARLPRGAVIATLPQGLAGRRAVQVNACIRAEAPRGGLAVADVWAHTGPPWQGKYARDMFHPNDVGYADWAAALREAVAAASLPR